MVEERADDLLEIRAVDGVDLGRDAERHARRDRHADGRVRALLRRDAPEEEEEPTGSGVEPEQIAGQAMMDGRRPRHAGERRALRIAHRHQSHLGKGAIDRRELRQVEPAVERHDRRRGVPGQRQPEVVGVTVDDVEVAGALVDAEEHGEVERHGVDRPAAEAQTLRAAGNQARAGDRVPAGEERDVVSAGDQLLGQEGDHPFGPAVAARRDALVERGDLRDSHDAESFGCLRLIRGAPGSRGSRAAGTRLP